MNLDRAAIEKFVPEGNTEFDVIVAGGGPAGLGAALASAVLGARTLLLEAKGFLGGVAAVSHWMPFNRLFLNNGSRGGVHELFVAALRKYGTDGSRKGREHWVDGDNLDIHPDYLRIAALEALESAGCCYRLHSPVAEVLMDGRRITGVATADKEGRSLFYARTVIDATGDGDVAHFCGAEMVKGREEDGKFMFVTLSFVLSNVDEEKFNPYIAAHGSEFNTLIEGAAKEGYCTSWWYSFNPTTVPGMVSVNNGGARASGNIDATHARDLTVAERLGIQLAVDFVAIAREKQIPGLEACCLARVGADLGVRETRRILGDYVLTLEDVTTGKEFEDIVARKYGEIDPGGLKQDRDYSHSMKSGCAYPYRCLLPKGIEGLLVAGRCGSATHLAHSAGKSMGNMMALGQAAGVAAALCAKENTTPRVLDVKKIQAALADMGVKLSQ